MAKTITIIADYDLAGLQRIARNAATKKLMQRYTDAGLAAALLDKINASDTCNFCVGIKRIPDIREVCDLVNSYGLNLLNSFLHNGYDKDVDEIPWSILVAAPVTFAQLYEKLNAEAQAVLKPIAKARKKDAFIDWLDENTIYRVNVTSLDTFITTCKEGIYEILGIQA